MWVREVAYWWCYQIVLHALESMQKRQKQRSTHRNGFTDKTAFVILRVKHEKQQDEFCCWALIFVFSCALVVIFWGYVMWLIFLSSLGTVCFKSGDHDLSHRLRRRLIVLVVYVFTSLAFRARQDLQIIERCNIFRCRSHLTLHKGTSRTQIAITSDARLSQFNTFSPNNSSTFA